LRNATTDIERVLNLIQFTSRASQDWRGTELCFEGAGDGRVGVGLAGARGNAGIGKPLCELADGGGVGTRDSYLVCG
jgi:hypothetical protein